MEQGKKKIKIKKKSFPAGSLDHWLAALGACIKLEKIRKNANKFIKNKIQIDFNYYDY